jgi:hypothetical protein
MKQCDFGTISCLGAPFARGVEIDICMPRLPHSLGAGLAFKIAPTIRLLLLKSFGQSSTAQACRGR